jgi:hypothetical protein
VPGARWHRPVIPALRRLRQEDGEFEASLSYSKKPSKQNKTERWQGDVLNICRQEALNVFREDTCDENVSLYSTTVYDVN